nr:Pot1 [Tetrahymena thermophila]
MNQHNEEFFTLNELYLKQKRSIHIVAIILDCTAQYKTANDYLTRIKIIDDTFVKVDNNDTKKGYFEVCQFSQLRCKSPKVQKIGDIIYLRRYNVSANDDDRLQIQTNHQAKCSFHIFDSEQQHYNVIDSDYDGQLQISEILQERIKQLRSYCFQIFSTKSLMQMIWYGLEPQRENQINKKDFDMLLRIQDIEQIQNFDESLDPIPMVKLTLIDSDNNNYYLTFQDRNYTKGQVVKIRSVRHIENEGVIVKNDYSNVLKLSNFFYDFKNFQQIKYDMIEYMKNNFDFDDYIEDPSDEYRRFSVLKKIHSTNNTITSLQDLLKIQTNPSQYSIIKTQKFKTQCYIVDIQPQTLEEAVKKVSYMNHNICVSLKDSSNYNKHAELNRILEAQIVVKDQSIDSTLNILQLVLIQEEREKHHDFFKGVELQKITSENIQQYEQNYQKICQRLCSHSNTHRTVDIVVQPILFNDRILFRIVDTQFLP